METCFGSESKQGSNCVLCLRSLLLSDETFHCTPEYLMPGVFDSRNMSRAWDNGQLRFVHAPVLGKLQSISERCVGIKFSSNKHAWDASDSRIKKRKIKDFIKVFDGIWSRL